MGAIRAVAEAEDPVIEPTQCYENVESLAGSLACHRHSSTAFCKYRYVCGERDGSSSRSDAELDASYLGGGATKKSARPVATPRADGGCGRSLCWSSSKMAKHRLPPPALISPRKPHLQTYRYLQNAVLVTGLDPDCLRARVHPWCSRRGASGFCSRSDRAGGA